MLGLAGYVVAADDLPGAIAAARESIGIHGAREPDHALVALASARTSTRSGRTTASRASYVTSSRPTNSHA